MNILFIVKKLLMSIFKYTVVNEQLLNIGTNLSFRKLNEQNCELFFFFFFVWLWYWFSMGIKWKIIKLFQLIILSHSLKTFARIKSDFTICSVC